MAVWAAAFVGLLPVGALITAGLAAWLGAGGGVVVDAVVMLLGSAAVMLRRPEMAWLDAPPYRRPESRRPILRQSRSNGSSRSRIGQTPSCETLSAHPRRSGSIRARPD
jgi:hypothetical protein